MKIIVLLILSFVGLVQAKENFTFHQDWEGAVFETIYQDFKGARSRLDKKLLSSYQILFVQGLATNITHELGKYIGPLISKQPGFLSPFYQQKKLLERLNIPYAFIPINPNDGCEKNGDAVANAILETYARHQKKVILITQSKAGPDALHGLLGNYLARRKVAGWLAYQPPHLGTFLADAPTNSSFGKKFVDLSFHLLKGSGLAIKDMRRDYREDFMREHSLEITEMLKHLPLVTLVTDDVPLKSLMDYLLIPFKGQSNEVSFLAPFVAPITENGGGINDGIAMVNGTCLTGDRACIYLHGIDHFAAVMNTSPYKTLTERERILIFQSLLYRLTNFLE